MYCIRLESFPIRISLILFYWLLSTTRTCVTLWHGVLVCVANAILIGAKQAWKVGVRDFKTYLFSKIDFFRVDEKSIFHYAYQKTASAPAPHAANSLAPMTILLSEPDGWISVYGVQSPKKIIEMTISNDFDLK